MQQARALEEDALSVEYSSTYYHLFANLEIIGSTPFGVGTIRDNALQNDKPTDVNKWEETYHKKYHAYLEDNAKSLRVLTKEEAEKYNILNEDCLVQNGRCLVPWDTIGNRPIYLLDFKVNNLVAIFTFDISNDVPYIFHLGNGYNRVQEVALLHCETLLSLWFKMPQLVFRPRNEITPPEFAYPETVEADAKLQYEVLTTAKQWIKTARFAKKSIERRSDPSYPVRLSTSEDVEHPPIQAREGRASWELAKQTEWPVGDLRVRFARQIAESDKNTRPDGRLARTLVNAVKFLVSNDNLDETIALLRAKPVVDTSREFVALIQVGNVDGALALYMFIPPRRRRGVLREAMKACVQTNHNKRAIEALWNLGAPLDRILVHKAIEADNCDAVSLALRQGTVSRTAIKSVLPLPRQEGLSPRMKALLRVVSQ